MKTCSKCNREKPATAFYSDPRYRDGYYPYCRLCKQEMKPKRVKKVKEIEPVSTQLRHCPTCNLDLPLNEFGISRRRKDGRNFYCKGCIRKRVYASRVAL